MDVIVLSDSDESTTNVEINARVREIDALSDSSFEFPEVNFHYEKTSKKTQKHVEENVGSVFDLCDIDDHNCDSGLYSKSSSQPGYSQDSAADILQKYSILNNAENPKRKKTTNSSTQKTQDLDKERLKAEKKKKKEEQAREKALKAATSKNLKNFKPQECLKFMKVNIDEEIQKCGYFNNIFSTLLENELTFNVSSQLIPRSILWTRQVEESFANEKGEICTSKKLQDENQMIIVWNWDEVVEKISNGTFAKSVSDISKLLPDKRVTLFVYGMKDYFAFQKKVKEGVKRNVVLRELGNEKESAKRYNKKEKIYQSSARISKNDFEVHLTEIQVRNGWSHKIIHLPEELSQAICQYTKSIAEAPYKNEKNKNIGDKVSWYAAGDNRDTVKVDKDGNGLKRLWQQQLCQFNLSSLEIAEAVSQVYGSPLKLMEAYMKCTPAAGEMLLKDVAIRRTAGPVTSHRKIGPELSKKIFIMFTSENGEILLNNDIFN